MASDPRRAQEVFLAAVEQPQANRAAFLDLQCGGDDELRQRVEALLAAHEASGSFLDQPAAAPRDATGPYTPQPEDAPQLPATTDYHAAVEPGSVIAGRYTLVEKIGEGGMGEVWVARQTEPVKRNVALKLIKPGMDSKQVLTRFEAERQALALMDHPNIAKVLDGGLTGDRRPFFVMELVNGLPLTRFCDEAKLTPRQRLELFVPVCQAVQHAHTKGIVHRDLKPSNILVTLYDGRPVPKVIDFGVAKATGGKLSDESVATQFGAVIGTLEYMAPEQAGFSALDIDTRADIYALGVVLYELLTGLRPFDAKRLRQAALDEVIRILREEEPSRPSARLSTDEALPSLAALRQTEPKKLMALMRGELDWVVMKCLEKGRERRYETASGLARDIERYLADEPVEARPPSAGYRLRKFARRNRGPLAAAAVVFLALLAGIVGTSLGLARAVDERKKADDARETAQANETKAVQAGEQLRDARDELWSNLYVSRAALIQGAWDASQYGRVRELLAAQVPVGDQRDLRGFEWHYLDRQLNADLRTVVLPRTRLDPIGPISPDATRLLRHVTEGDTTWLKSFDTSTGREVLAIKMPVDAARDSTFSTDGKWIVAGVRDESTVGFGKPLYLRRWDAVTGAEDVRLREVLWGGWPLSGPNGLPVLCREPGWQPILGSPEKTYAFGLWDGQEVKKVTTSLRRDGGYLALSPDGTVLAVSGRGEVWLVNVRTAKVMQTLPVHANILGGVPVAFSPDGGRIAIAGEKTLTVWEAATGRQVLEVKETVRSPVISPDLTRIAYVTWPSFHPTSGAAQVRIVDAATGEVRRSLRGHDGDVTNLAFSRDGTVLVTAGLDDRIKHWDATLDERVPALKAHTGRNENPGLVMGFKSTVTPDASRLVVSGLNGFWVWGRGEKPIFTSPPPRVKFGGMSPAPGPLVPNVGPTVPNIGLPGPKLGPPEVKADPKTPKPAPAGPLGKMGVTGPGASLISADGRRVVWWWNHHGFPDGDKFKQETELQLWDPDAGRQLVEVVREGKFLAAELSPDGRRLAAAVESPGEVILWDADSGRELCRRPLPRGREFRLAFSPDGRRFAAIGSGDSTIVVGLWDAEDGQPVPSASVPSDGKPQYSIFPPVFDSEARRIAVPLETAGGIVRVWDVETGSHAVDLKGVKGLGQVSHLAFSPDGHRLAMVSEGKVKLWDPDTGAELLAITADGYGIEHLAFTANGHAIDLVVETNAGFETRRLDATPRAGANPP